MSLTPFICQMSLTPFICPFICRVVTLANGAEITLQQHYAAGNAHRIENLKFADTTIDAATLDTLVATIAPATADNDVLRCDNVSHCWLEQGEISYLANDDEWRVAA